MGQQKISVASFLVAALLLTGFIYLSKLSQRLVERVLKDTQLDMGVRGSIESIIRYAVLTVGILITMDSVGLNVSSLAAIGAVLMVGIGFGLQNIAQNFISGLILLLERPIRRGDIVSVAGVKGRVKEIRARSTLIETRDDVSIIVPNSQFISEQVINDSFSGNVIREKVDVAVAYGSDTRKVEQVLLEAAEAHSKVQKSPPPRVVFESFGDSSLNFSLRIWISDIWGRDFIMSDIRFDIDHRFRENQIQIPFPQRDLHLKSSDISLK